MENESSLTLKLAEAIHNDYISQRKKKNQRIDIPEKFSDLTGEFEEYRNSSINAAEDIIPKLNSINVGFRKVEDISKIKEFTFEVEEIEKLSDKEHERWNREKSLAGWSYGEVRNSTDKKHPYLIPYEKLPVEIKEYDREQVRLIPKIMKEVGFELFRMKENN